MSHDPSLSVSPDSAVALRTALPDFGPLWRANDNRRDAMFETIRTGGAVLFVGAGCSVPLGYPDWDGLVHELMTLTLHLENSFSTSYQLVGDGLLDQLDDARWRLSQVRNGTKRLHAKLSELFSPKDPAFGELQEALVALPWRGFVTSNYDPALEIALAAAARAGYPTEIDFQAAPRAMQSQYYVGLPNGRCKGTVAHVHGHFSQPKGLVLSRRDYNRAYGRNPTTKPLGLALYDIFLRSRCVFVGFSARDPFIRRCMEIAQEQRDQSDALGYLVLPFDEVRDQDPREFAGDLLRSANIQTVYYRKTEGDGHRGLLQMIRSLVPETARSGPSLSDRALVQGRALVDLGSTHDDVPGSNGARHAQGTRTDPEKGCGSSIPPVFLSYSTREPDSTVAHTIKQTLTAAGVEVFMASESIQVGDNWREQIMAALNGCQFFVVLLTERALQSQFVVREIRLVFEIPEERRPRVLPIHLDLPQDAPIDPTLYNRLEAIQFLRWESSDPRGLALALAARISVGSSSGLVLQKSSRALPHKTYSDPMPSFPLDIPEGKVEAASTFYVVPPIMKKAKDHILRRGGIIRIIAPHKFGRTSLLARISQYARDELGFKVCNVGAPVDRTIYQDADRFLRWFLSGVSKRAGVRIPAATLDTFDDCLDELTDSLDRPLLVGMDDLNELLRNPDSAIPLLVKMREISEDINGSALKWRFALTYHTEPRIALAARQSPLNVGLECHLEEFDRDQILDLAHRHGLDWSESELERMSGLIGGHPYLVRLALDRIASAETTLDEVVSRGAAGIFMPHLRDLDLSLYNNSDLLVPFMDVISSPLPCHLGVGPREGLLALGLIREESGGFVPSLELYRLYFSKQLPTQP